MIKVYPVYQSLCYLNERDKRSFVLQVSAGEEIVGEEESPTTVEVQVESSSIAAVCGLHHAVLRRVQVQTHTPPTFTAFSENLSCRHCFQINHGPLFR